MFVASDQNYNLSGLFCPMRSFFDSVPSGADAYILKTVLHNWDDENAAKILHNCRAVMRPGQRILVPDFLDVPEPLSTLVPFMDIAGM